MKVQAGSRPRGGILARFAVYGSLLGSIALAGCGAGNFGSYPQSTQPSPTPSTPYTGVPFSVKAMAGSTPLVGASVQLYAAGTGGNGSAATALLGSTVATDATGTAAVPAAYSCPSGAAMTYVLVKGGTLNGSTANSSTVLLGALGACSGVQSGGTYVVDEVTTVAGMYALAPFYAGGSIGASATNLTGLSNAFATAATLANAQTGSSAGTALPANGVSAAARIDSLANALNACLVKAANCTALYQQAPSGTPATTLDAVSDLAAYPTKNPAGIYAESLLSSAYMPVLQAQPADWTVFVTYSGGGLSSPGQLGIDSTGNVWVSNYFYTASKFTPIGAPVFASGITGYGLNNSYGLAVDGNDNAWVTNEQPFTAAGIGSMSEFSSGGTALSGSGGYIDGGLNFPISVAIDPNGTTWVVDYGNSHVTLLNSSGVPVSGASGYTTPLFAFPVVVAVDGNHFGWVGNQASNFVTKVAPDGSSFTNYNCCNGASAIAVDQGDNIWVANFYGNSVSLISSSGALVAAGTYTSSGGINHPEGIAIDGAGNAYIANYRASYLSALAGISSGAPGTSLAPATGLGGDAGLLGSFGVAIDASGNVWVSNQGNSTLTKFVGLAVPVKTPILGVARVP